MSACMQHSCGPVSRSRCRHIWRKKTLIYFSWLARVNKNFCQNFWLRRHKKEIWQHQNLVVPNICLGIFPVERGIVDKYSPLRCNIKKGGVQFSQKRHQLCRSFWGSSLYKFLCWYYTLWVFHCGLEGHSCKIGNAPIQDVNNQYFIFPVLLWYFWCYFVSTYGSDSAGRGKLLFYV